MQSFRSWCRSYEEHNSSINNNQKFFISGEEFVAHTTPGHTLDHLSYFSFHQNEPLLFCGDTLFQGCGRLFEGTPDQMHNSSPN